MKLLAKNSLTTITRATGTPTGGGFDGFVNELDYCVVYCKQIEKAMVYGLLMDNESAEIYNEVDENGNRYLIRSLGRTGRGWESFEEKMARLTSELSSMFKRSHKLEKEVKKSLGAIGYEV